jgi:hypothetical protein
MNVQQGRDLVTVTREQFINWAARITRISYELDSDNAQDFLLGVVSEMKLAADVK